MKKVTFNVNSPKDSAIREILKALNSIDCRLSADFGSGVITGESLDETALDVIIDAVSSNYNVASLAIDNLEQNTMPLLPQEKVCSSNEQKVPDISETDDYVTSLGLEDESLRRDIAQLVRTVKWTIYEKSMPVSNVEKYIFTAVDELTMYCNSTQGRISVQVGDVVQCSYGTHLPGEINGRYASSIVCGFLGDCVYLVPIAKELNESLGYDSCLEIAVPDDITYSEPKYNGGIALIDKSKYMHRKRLLKIIGKASPKFMDKVFDALLTAFDFRKKVSDASSTEPQETTDVASNDTVQVLGNKPTKPEAIKLTPTEEILLEYFGSAFNKLEPNASLESFFRDIGLPYESFILTEAFRSAFFVNKISYDSILAEVHSICHDKDEQELRLSIQNIFKDWLKNYPELTKRCPKLSVIPLIKLFVKKCHK